MDDVLELWVLADMYQMEGLKHTCMGALERGLCKENVTEISQEVEDLSCPCDELKRMCHDFLDRQAWLHYLLNMTTRSDTETSDTTNVTLSTLEPNLFLP
jgi:hypothetical protein